MNKISLPEVQSITVSFDGSDIRTKHGIIASSVYVDFTTSEGADAFWSTLNTSQKDHLQGADFFITFSPTAKSLTGPKTSVKLNLGFGQTNQGIRANAILSFLQLHFDLPTKFSVTYSESATILAKWKTVSLPLAYSEVVGRELSGFLAVLAEFTLRQSTLQDNLCNLIGTKVLVDARSASSLQITCTSSDEARALKKVIFNLAVDSEADHLFSLASVAGVAGVSHQNIFVITAQDGVDFDRVLNKLVEITLGDQENLDVAPLLS